ncbi:MAG: UbiA family prenyltransferase [Bdellovibrionales bacterium]|nr:UbiA family prenyltransferase [Bdellovibrionales bacterium]
MAHWITYIQERFPIPTYALLVIAMTSSGAYLYSEGPSSTTSAWALSLIGLLLFFFELRLMDEYKDYEKDLIAHPHRPLPRGLIDRKHVRTAIYLGLIGMIGFGALLVGMQHPKAAGIYIFNSIYLGLMFKEFFIGSWIGEKPFIYGVTHQVVLIPLMAFPVSLFAPQQLWNAPTLFLGMTALGGFFTYELCRKLSMNAHPILKTYPQVYGVPGTLLRILLVGSFGILGALYLHVDKLCVPLMCLTLAAAIAWSLRPHLHKIVEVLATIGLLAHLASVFITKFFRIGV